MGAGGGGHATARGKGSGLPTPRGAGSRVGGGDSLLGVLSHQEQGPTWARVHMRACVCAHMCGVSLQAPSPSEMHGRSLGLCVPSVG